MVKPAHVTPGEAPRRSWLTRFGIRILGFVRDSLGNRSPVLESGGWAGARGGGEHGFRVALRIAVSAATGFALVAAALWSEASWAALVGGALLVGATIYFLVFVFTRASLIKRAFATVATMSALSVASAGFGFSANIGALLVELGIVTKDPGITFAQDALSWSSVIILVVINAFLFLAVRAEARN